MKFDARSFGVDSHQIWLNFTKPKDRGYKKLLLNLHVLAIEIVALNRAGIV
jgi:hypothetical protein